MNPIDSEHDAKIKRLAGKIDRVLVDAPCSGLGTLRRNPDLKWRQTRTAIDELTPKQASILASAARLVKKGGRLVYATCSVLDAENERIVEQFLADHPEFVLVPAQKVLDDQRIGSRRATTCRCGRIATRPTASSPRCSNGALRSNGGLDGRWRICRAACCRTGWHWSSAISTSR